MRGPQGTPVTVVIATRDRVTELRRTLARLSALPDRPAIIVVDNGSADGTAAAVRRDFPGVTVIRNRRNRRAAARNQGARRAVTPYVAFSDDDSWWEPGALARACDLLARYPAVGVIAGRTLVGEHAADDPINALLAASPLRAPGLASCRGRWSSASSAAPSSPGERPSSRRALLPTPEKNTDARAEGRDRLAPDATPPRPAGRAKRAEFLPRLAVPAPRGSSS